MWFAKNGCLQYSPTSSREIKTGLIPKPAFWLQTISESTIAVFKVSHVLSNAIMKTIYVSSNAHINDFEEIYGCQKVRLVSRLRIHIY